MRIFPSLFSAFSVFSICTLTVHASLFGNNTSGIAAASYSPNVVSITPTTIRLAVGETRSFTVDSPRDQGAISTAANVGQLVAQLSFDGEIAVVRGEKPLSPTDVPTEGDRLIVTGAEGNVTGSYTIETTEAALAGKLVLRTPALTAGAAPAEVVLDYTVGQRTPRATVVIKVPAGINVTMDNTFVNVIGRGEVALRDLSTQSIGRTGTHYSYNRVGTVLIDGDLKTGQTITFSEVDLRPLNAPDIRLRIKGVQLQATGDYIFKARYTTSEPKKYTSVGGPSEVAVLTVKNTIADFSREPLRQFSYTENADTYTSATFKWTPFSSDAADATIFGSTNNGATWKKIRSVNLADGVVRVDGLEPDKLYSFKLVVASGAVAGDSNVAHFFTGLRDIKSFGVSGGSDDTDAINAAIEQIHALGGGTLRFTKGTYNVRTLHLLSNVWLYLDHDATIQCIGGCDAPEAAWFSDRDYRSGTSPTDSGPYRDPENWMTKQDVGHTYFRNATITAERQDNIKIIGSGRITGNGALVNSDGVMNGPADKRADKMFSFKLCTQIEIGGHANGKDLWYDEKKDEPYYIESDKTGAAAKNFDVSNMLNIDRGGHFALLATGVDDIHVHDTYFGKASTGNARDIYDFMACNNVTVTNIYSKCSSDDIVKPGSDCSLGFTRPARNLKVRNIIGDTNCNLFQIGSETADDIQDLCVDNIYVLGANKAGFSISTNDGGHIRNVHLNCGHTGAIHSRSKMLRTRAPFFISISNRGRILGAEAKKFKFNENGVERSELLCTNVNIGQVENIIINGIDCTEVYGGSSYGKKDERWKPYDGKQNRATPIIAGFKVPDSNHVEGGLTFKLPDGRHTGYITNVSFTDVSVLVKGGNPASDRDVVPPEIGVGKYNVGDLKTQPAYGFWARHVKNFVLKNCSVNYEEKDGRYAVVLDDVIGARIENLKCPPSADGEKTIKAIACEDVEAR